MKLLSDTQLAEELGVAVGTLRNWRVQGNGIPFVRVNGAIRYRPADVEGWLASRVVTSTSQSVPA